MTALRKSDFPLIDVRQHLETGPIVLVTSAWKGQSNIMTMGWHTMMQFSPALFGCYIWSGNHSYDLIRNSQQCVINVPTVELVDQVVAVGNSSGAAIDKFAEFALTPVPAARVGAPLIKECYANFECQLFDSKLIGEYGLFIWEVVKAHVAKSVENPQTLHYRGQGRFMVAGDTLDLREQFRPQNLRCPRLGSLAIVARRHPDFPFEHLGKMAWAAVTHVQANIDDAAIGF